MRVPSTRALCLLLLLLHGGDLGCTLLWLDRLSHPEAAPVMAAALAQGGPGFFGFSKAGLAGLGVLLLWRLRGHTVTRGALLLLNVGYAWLLLAHVVSLILFF